MNCCASRFGAFVSNALEADAPKRLAKQFIALTTVKLVQKILEIAWRRLLVALQPKQLRNFIIVKFVHERGR